MTRLASRPELRPARTHAPEALAALESAHAAACGAIDPVLADALRRRVARSLGVVVESATPPTEPEQACAAFADQFVVSVPGVTHEQRDAVAGLLGPEQVLELARMLYVFDMTERLVISLGCLFPPESDRAAEVIDPVEPQPLGAAVEGLHAAAMRLHALDPVTTELVRLHCARYHDCKT
jgi:alkylhydroperoxidase family enzyme